MDCLCGCGREVKSGRFFLSGHNTRNHKPWNLGLTKEMDERVAKYGNNGSETRKRRIISGEIVPWNKGLTKEVDERVAQAGRTISIRNKGREAWNTGLTKEVDGSVARIALAKVGKPRSKEVKEKCRLRTKLNWQNPEYVRKQMQANGVKPNRLEIQAESILNPLGFEYVGDGQLIVGGKCPDFWNRDHKLVEIFGDFWHKGQNQQDRIDFFKQFGYDTLVVWEHEFSDLKTLEEKIITYSTARVS